MVLPFFLVLHFFLGDFSKRANLHPESNLIVKLRLLSGCRFFHSWTPAGRENPEHVGVSRRSSKGLRACPRQHLRRIPANEIQLLACPDGAPRVCGYAHANICAGYLLTRFNCWRDQTVLQRFAGMPTPTRSCPSLRKECLPYTKGNPREKSEEPYYLGSCIEMCTYGKL